MSGPSVEAKPPIYKHMLAGSLWALGMRWSMRSIGLVSVVILSRLLTPADFGVVAMGFLLMGFIDGFAELGTGMLILRQRDVTRADLDTAWTIRLIQGVVVGLALIVSAPFAVRYFAEPRVLPVIVVLALCSVLGAACNIGGVLIRKDLDFAKDFRYGIYTKLASFFPTLAFALLLRNYWALLLGYAVGSVVGLVLSYGMHPYRPRLSLERARHYLSFSISVVGANIARFLKSKIDVLIIGGNTNATIMGSYNVASELATMATQEIVIPIWRGLFPTFSKISDDHDRFVTAYGHFLSTVAMLCFPLGLGMWAVAEDFVSVLLGNQWTAVVAPLKWLAVGATILALIDLLSGNILFVSGHERRSALLTWIHLAVLIPAVIAAGRLGSAEAVAIAATVSAAVMLPIAAFVLMRSIKFPAVMMWRALWRPALAAGLMAITLKLFPAPAELPVVLRLAIGVLLGAAVYVCCLAGLWVLAGRPEGPERVVWRGVRGTLARVQGR